MGKPAEMNRRDVIRGMAAVSAAAGLGGCDFGPPVYAYRYKLSIEMDTPQGRKSGSNVVEVRFQQRKGSAGTRSIRTVRGEALYLDLGDGRRPLIALLTSRVRPTDKPGHARARCWGDNAPFCWQKLYDFKATDFDDNGYNPGFAELARQRGARPLPVSDLPDLVTFDDVDDPRTVKAVDPEAPYLALGDGVSFRTVTLEITDAPLTEEIEKRLPWLVGMKTNIAGARGPQIPGNLATIVGSHDFRRKEALP